MNKENIRVNFCQNIHYLRKLHNMTQKKMSQILNISVKKLGRIEKCDPACRIYGDMLCRVCDHFDLSADEILFENWTRMYRDGQTDQKTSCTKTI